MSLARSVRLTARNNEAALSVDQDAGARALALSTEGVNELGLRTGQSERLRTIAPHRLFLSMIAGLAGGQVESLADLFLAHAAQLVGGKPISTRRVAMCASHIIDEIVSALLACVSIAAAFRDGMKFLLANAKTRSPSSGSQDRTASGPSRSRRRTNLN